MKDSYECHMTTRIGPSRTQSNMPNSPIPRKDTPKQSFPGSQVSATHQCRVNLEPADDHADYSLYIQKCKITQALSFRRHPLIFSRCAEPAVGCRAAFPIHGEPTTT